MASYNAIRDARNQELSEELNKTRSYARELQAAVDELTAGNIERDRYIHGLASFDEMQTTNDRVGKLEDLVRVLTVQRSASGPANGRSPSLSQRVPVTGSNGLQTMELNVPKGNPLKPLKENRAPSRAASTDKIDESAGPRNSWY